jgi:hypothetical protein
MIGNMVAIIITGTSTGVEEQQLMNTLMPFTTYNVGFATVPVLNASFFTHGIGTILFWDYPFLSQPGYALVKYFILWPLTAGGIWGITMIMVSLLSALGNILHI